MNRNTLSLYPIDFPFETLVSRIEANPPKLILDPDFQRKYKWDNDGFERSSKFIESCLMRIPLPACYFAENEESNHLVIDGVQRLTTIQRFFNDEFALEGLTFYNHLNGMKFSELGDLKNELETTTIRCVVLRKENDKALIREIFARLNQGTVKLSDQEIRHAIYSGPFDELLTDIASHTFIQAFRNNDQKEDRSDEELVLRFFALESDLESYDGKLSKLLDDFMQDHQDISREDAQELANKFKTTLNKCMRTFDEPFTNANLEKNKRKGVVYYDLLMWSFSKLPDEIIDSNKNEIITAYSNLCENGDFQKNMLGGLQKKSSIIKRRKLWTAELRGVGIEI